MKGEATISKKRIFEEINYQAELLDNFKNNEQKITIDRYKKFLYLYGQVRWNQKILRYPIKWSEEFIEMYCDTVNKLTKKFNELDDTNFYILLCTEFYKNFL